MIKELYLPYFDNMKVTVMGLGLLGRGIGDTAFLAQNGAEIIVTDKKTKEQLAVSLEALKEYIGLAYVLGEHRLEDFENRDFILKSAGVPLDSEYIAHARSNKIPVYMSASLVCDIAMKELPDVVIIGVTGTRGKSTTTEMIAHVLRENGSRVHLGGNIRGVANLPLLDEIEDGDFLVLELDSWQLQGFGDMKISPHIAVFTSFMDDHMNYYKNDKEVYFNDKAYIYRNQHDGDVLIASVQAGEEIQKRDKKIKIAIPEQQHFDMKLIGEPNQVSAQLTYEVCGQCGLDDESIRASIATFSAVHGRLEDLGLFKKAKTTMGSVSGSPDSQGECRGIRVFNDNNATTCDATIRALEAVTATYNLPPVLIIGGSDKGLPLEELEKTIQEKTKAVVYLSGTGTDRITLPKEYEFEKLEDCIAKAFELAEEGDSILFSPAFASFSKYFNNEYERNDLFVKDIEKYRYKCE
jgi:UDP-N-acetylmuramoylalanine--D-glutamate ligase